MSEDVKISTIELFEDADENQLKFRIQFFSSASDSLVSEFEWYADDTPFLKAHHLEAPLAYATLYTALPWGWAIGTVGALIISTGHPNSSRIKKIALDSAALSRALVEKGMLLDLAAAGYESED